MNQGWNPARNDGRRKTMNNEKEGKQEVSEKTMDP